MFLWFMTRVQQASRGRPEALVKGKTLSFWSDRGAEAHLWLLTILG